MNMASLGAVNRLLLNRYNDQKLRLDYQDAADTRPSKRPPETVEKRPFSDLELDRRRGQVPRSRDPVLSQQVYMVIILSFFPQSNSWLSTRVTVMGKGE